MRKVNFVVTIVLILSIGRVCLATPVEWSVDNGGNGHYYEVIFVEGGIYWTDAKSAAELMGGHLATITSEAENTFVCSLINWQWVTEEPFVYTNWHIDNPSNSGNGEDYLGYLHDAGQWNDFSNDHGVVAEYVVETIPEPTTFLLFSLDTVMLRKK